MIRIRQITVCSGSSEKCLSGRLSGQALYDQNIFSGINNYDTKNTEQQNIQDAFYSGQDYNNSVNTHIFLS